MTDQQLRALLVRDTDVRGALRRLYDDEALYTECLTQFVSDPTWEELNAAVANQAWDEAFTAAHALKGVAGNLGFVPLMHATGQLVVLIRGGRLRELDEGLMQVNSCYRDIIDAIAMNFEDTQEKGEKQ